ncbi:hypothetical protein ACFO4N_09140 [Camelliibacillus cellulosilyticus]|uniref:Acetyltransferase (GNAT) family protein n=1 Tax=Camelliibacillus cellulosilyticus TaxID=2174486 RepID=A0ABV9GKR0_9BACL
MASWSEDADYLRKADTDYAVPLAAESFQESKGKTSNSIEFRLRTLEDESLIGFVALFGIEWNNQCGKVAIGIGDPHCRNKGYGKFFRRFEDDLLKHAKRPDCCVTKDRR